MQSDTARRIRYSLIQLIIGIGLLVLAWNYLSNHPAEMQSIESSFMTARQKVSQLFARITGEQTTTITAQKDKALSSIQEIISAIKSCDPSESVTEYQILYDAIKNSSIQEFARNSIQYYNQASKAYTRMQQICDQEASEDGREVTLGS